MPMTSITGVNSESIAGKYEIIESSVHFMDTMIARGRGRERERKSVSAYICTYRVNKIKPK